MDSAVDSFNSPQSIGSARAGLAAFTEWERVGIAVPIFIDHSEAREGTRLPQAVIDSSQVIVGLEKMTGADLLISPLSKPKLPGKLKDVKPHVRMLRTHTTAGVLVQRKSRLDLISSIGDLHSIQKRMLDWCGPIGPWLLAVGRYEQRKDGRMVVSGSEIYTKHTYKSIIAAFDWWTLRGGGVTVLDSDNRITAWVNHWHQEMLPRLNESPERLVIDRLPAQALKSEDDTWWAPLAVIPGIGEGMARSLAEWLPEHKRSLAHAIVYLCDDRNAKIPERPAGFGPKKFKATRALFGLTDDDIIRIISIGDRLEHYPVMITWPEGVSAATVDGQWWKRDDGRVEAVYNSQDELRVCLETMGVMK